MANGISGFLKVLNKILDFYYKPRRIYVKLNNDDEKREKSNNLGVNSIIWSILTVLFVFLFTLGAQVCFGNFDAVFRGESNVNLPIGSVILGIICCFGAVFTFLEGVLSSLFYMIFQFKLNKRPVKIVALIFFIAAIVASVVVVYVILFA